MSPNSPQAQNESRMSGHHLCGCGGPSRKATWVMDGNAGEERQHEAAERDAVPDDHRIIGHRHRVPRVRSTQVNALGMAPAVTRFSFSITATDRAARTGVIAMQRGEIR